MSDLYVGQHEIITTSSETLTAVILELKGKEVLAQELGTRREDILKSLLKKFEHLHVKKTWGETSLFFNPEEKSPNGSYFLTLKESDGENDKASELDRKSIFRISFGISRTTYENLFGPTPPRPAKGGVVQTGHDFRQTNHLMPHPIYAWMNWVQILNPSANTWMSIQDLIEESYQLSKNRFEKR